MALSTDIKYCAIGSSPVLVWPPLRPPSHPCYERRRPDPTRRAEMSSKNLRTSPRYGGRSGHVWRAIGRLVTAIPNRVQHEHRCAAAMDDHGVAVPGDDDGAGGVAGDIDGPRPASYHCAAALSGSSGLTGSRSRSITFGDLQSFLLVVANGPAQGLPAGPPQDRRRRLTGVWGWLAADVSHAGQRAAPRP